MSGSLTFQGFIKNVSYTPCLIKARKSFGLQDFNINSALAYGDIKKDTSIIAYSKWVSPKRTRSYPFARIYNTYEAQKVITIIPVLKDEGADGDLDKIQFSTFSWMSLLNVYIVLGYYDDAKRSSRFSDKQKITGQKFNTDCINLQIQEIFQYRQSALHWNRTLLEDRFSKIFRRALSSYKDIETKTGVRLHSQENLEKHLGIFQADFKNFKDLSLKASKRASQRESQTDHALENTPSNTKALLKIENYLGGVYHLTADEVIEEQGVYTLQESKNATSDPLPKLADIQDGLFKLILFSNLDSLECNGKQVPFTTRLYLTGKGVKETLDLPSKDTNSLPKFLAQNSSVFRKPHIALLNSLEREIASNRNISLRVKGNGA